MPRFVHVFGLSALVIAWAAPARAQLFTLTRDQMIAYTPKNPFERFDDGRPKIPDALLKRASVLSVDELWVAMGSAKYPSQFEAGWQILQPGRKLIGRAVTAQFMPVRPDLAEVLDAEAKAKGRPPQVNQRVIDLLRPGDVVVVDLFGKVEQGTFVGNNLAAAIYGATKTGFVVDGSIRDLNRILEVGVQGYVRATHPSAIGNVMLTGLNVPIRIGNTTVMPGDLVFGDREGLSFVPPQLVEEAIVKAEKTELLDQWRKKKLLSGKYKPSDLYPNITQPQLKAEYEQFLKTQGKPSK